MEGSQRDIRHFRRSVAKFRRSQFKSNNPVHKTIRTTLPSQMLWIVYLVQITEFDILNFTPRKTVVPKRTLHMIYVMR